jgi:AcrR family transcriptional regulator
VTFYRHFPTKDDLIVAYLEQRAAVEREGVSAALAASEGDVDKALQLMAEAIGAAACSPGFRGCPFINAAAEYGDPDSPVRRDAHRAWYRKTYEDLIAPLDLADQAAVAEALLLRDGVMIAGYLGDAAGTAHSFLPGSQ